MQSWQCIALQSEKIRMGYGRPSELYLTGELQFSMQLANASN